MSNLGYHDDHGGVLREPWYLAMVSVIAIVSAVAIATAYLFF
jgi:hypothetical protein